MKKRTALVVLLALSAGVAWTATPVVTRPTAPANDALNALSLKLGWQARLPVDGERDGIATIQVIPGQILVQLRSGVVVALDPETGQTQWRMLVSDPYHVTHALGYNTKSIFGYHTTRMYALDRVTGKIQWQYELPNVPTTPPVADETEVFVCTAKNRLHIYALPPIAPALEVASENQPKERDRPIPNAMGPLPEPKAERNPYYAKQEGPTSAFGQRSSARSSTGPLSTAAAALASLHLGFQLQSLYEVNTRARVETRPLVTPTTPDVVGNAVVLLGVNGAVESFGRIDREDWDLVYRAEEDTPAATSPGQYGSMGYFSFQNGNLIAVDVVKRRRLWRFAAAGGAAYRPAATDDALFLSVKRVGLSRLNRESGLEEWQNAKADKFLSASKKFVYATDASGQLLVLDATRGITVGTLNTRDFNVPVSNELTDRVYLASNDGLVICLHDRDFVRPAWSRMPPAEKKPVAKPAEEGDKKPEEKKAEEKKPEEKKPEEKKKADDK